LNCDQGFRYDVNIKRVALKCRTANSIHYTVKAVV